MPTTISWTNETWNPLRARDKETGKTGHFCVKVASGCAGCYASALNQWRGNGLEYLVKNKDRMELYLDEKALRKVFRYPPGTMVFTFSMTDPFGTDFGVTTEMLDTIYAIMALTPNVTYQNLTKRAKARQAYLSDPETPFRVAKKMDEIMVQMKAARTYNVSETQIRNIIQGKQWAVSSPIEWPLMNCWEGVSVACNKDVHQVETLLETPAALRWVSYEPAIEWVDFGEFLGNPFEEKNLDWLVIGGESGPQARPFNIAWARETINACRQAGVPVFVKQMGAKPQRWLAVTTHTGPGHCVPLRLADKKGEDMTEWPPDLHVREWPEGRP